MEIFIKSEFFTLNCSRFYTILPALKLTLRPHAGKNIIRVLDRVLSPAMIEATVEINKGFRDSSLLL